MKRPNCPTDAVATNSGMKEEIAVNNPTKPAAYDVALRMARQIAPSVPVLEAAMRAQRIAQDSPAVMDLATNQALIHAQAQLAAVSSPVMDAVRLAQAHPVGVMAVYLANR